MIMKTTKIRTTQYVIAIALAVLLIYGFFRLWSNFHRIKVISINRDIVTDDTYSWTKECNEKLDIFYTELLSCLKSIDHPELLDRTISDDVNKRDQCYAKLNRDTQISDCFHYSNYDLIGSTCGLMFWQDDTQDTVTNNISQVLCIRNNRSLISSWQGIIDFRRNFDWSSFISCDNNSDCPDDEFCSIQWIQRCEKIVGVFDGWVELVTSQQMRTIIKENCDLIKSWWDSHSMVNSIVLKNGESYVVRDVNVSKLIHENCSSESISKMELWIE